VEVGDITVRDGLQALEHYFPAEEKVRLAEELILSGLEHIEVTNFGHPKYLPQFKDAEELLDRLFNSERVGSRLRANGGNVWVTVVTINERAVNRALEYKAKRGFGPDYLLQMVSTDPVHHKTNSGMELDDYWRMTEKCTRMAAEQGVGMCGTVSTIWGSPMEGSRVTDLKKGVEFSRIYLDMGASYIEQADHDGSADPQRSYEYFSMILDPEYMGKWSDPKYHLAHFHTSRGMGLANVLAALMAGIYRFESTLSGVGGQPANMHDGVLIRGTGQYYHKEHLLSGLVGTEDLVVMLEAMGVKTGVDIPKLLETGRLFRDRYLKISPALMEMVLRNIQEFTKLPREELNGLRSGDKAVEELVESATAHLTKAGESPEPLLKENLEMLFHSLKIYLQTGHWGLSRAESLVSEVPLHRFWSTFCKRIWRPGWQRLIPKNRDPRRFPCVWKIGWKEIGSRMRVCSRRMSWCRKSAWTPS
jgi:hydroxymethylglutaryl-CoA lyase